MVFLPESDICARDEPPFLLTYHTSTRSRTLLDVLSIPEELDAAW